MKKLRVFQLFISPFLLPFSKLERERKRENFGSNGLILFLKENPLFFLIEIFFVFQKKPSRMGMVMEGKLMSCEEKNLGDLINLIKMVVLSLI